MIVITKTVALPKPIAVLNFLEVPIKGHNPKKFINTKLLTNILLKNNEK